MPSESNGLYMKGISALSQQEKSIYDLNKQNNTLTKALEVMKHRAEFMEEEIAPKDNQIEELKEQIQEVFYCIHVMSHTTISDFATACQLTITRVLVDC